MLGRKSWAESLLSEVSAKFPWAEASAQFPELDALLEAKCFSLHEMQVHISTNGVEASALEAASAMSFPALSNSSAKNPIPGVDLSEVSANLPAFWPGFGK